MKTIKISIRDGKFGRQYSTLTKELNWLNVTFLDFTPDPELEQGIAYVSADQIWVSPATEKYKARTFIKGNIEIIQHTLNFE